MRIVVETSSKIAPPIEGEVWLHVDSGMLYEIRQWREATYQDFGNSICGAHHLAHRIDAPESKYGCDPSVFVAVFDHDVCVGRWIKVENFRAFSKET